MQGRGRGMKRDLDCLGRRFRECVTEVDVYVLMRKRKINRRHPTGDL